MKLNKIGTIALMLLVLMIVVNAVAAEDNTLVGAADVKLMAENDDAVALDHSDSDSNAKLSATNSQAILQSGQTGNYTELKSLIESNPGGTIELDKDYAYADGEDKNITIPHSITINGKGFKISGENAAGLFIIPSTVSNVVLNNISFVNGNSTSMLWIAGDHCLVDNCTFENNSLTNESLFSPVRINGVSNVVNNTKFKDNDGVYGGALYVATHGNVIDNCTFVNNTANYGYGGAVCLNGRNNSIRNSIFQAKDIEYAGGAVYMAGIGNLVYNCTFKNVEAQLGGAIYI
jgi:hypothetical protein